MEIFIIVLTLEHLGFWFGQTKFLVGENKVVNFFANYQIKIIERNAAQQ